MVRIRSRLVRRGRTGRKASGLKVARRRTQVHKHHHRRYAGVHVKTTAPKRRKAGISRASKPGRKKRALHKRHMRHGLHRKFHGRKKSQHKRHVKPGQHHAFKGRKFHGRHVKPGQHRRFLGRKSSTPKRRISPPKPEMAPISSASYLSMF